MNLKPKQITSAVNAALATGFQINTTGDAAFAAEQAFSWDDLNTLKQQLGQGVLEFVGQVNAIITNPQIISNLGNKKAHFERVTEVFFSDINTFSQKVQELRVQHEHLTGPVTDLNQTNLYNRIAFSYHTLYSELQVLVTPTLSDLVMTVHELTIPTAPAAETTPVNPQ